MPLLGTALAELSQRGGRFLNVCARKLGVAQDKEGYEPDREGKRKKRAEREGGGGGGGEEESGGVKGSIKIELNRDSAEGNI